MDYPPEGTTSYTGTSDDLGFALKIILYILVGAVFFLASFVAYLYVFFLPPAPDISAHEFTDADFATVYSDPISTFNLSEGNVVVTDVTEGTLGIQIKDSVVYTFGYISNDGVNWRRVMLRPGQGAVMDENEMWISNNATYEHLINSREFNITQYPYTAVGYVALYSCSRSPTGQWDCHDGWQIQQFTTVIVTDKTGAKDPCGGCNTGFVCVQKRCVREENVRNAARVSAGDSLSVVVKGKEYLLTVTSISGDGMSSKISVNGQAFTVDKSVNDIYFVKDDFRFLINRIQPFTSDRDGFLEIIVVGEYEGMDVCENCVYKPAAAISTGGSGGSSSSGRSEGSGSTAPVVCTPKTCAQLGYECGTWTDGCKGTVTCGPCDTANGYTCRQDEGKCFKHVCLPSCSDEPNVCAGVTFGDRCGGTCTGTLQPDCTNPVTEDDYECGLSPNSCGWCNETDNYCVNTYGEDYVCNQNMCSESCTPNCIGKECGSDTCEWHCGLGNGMCSDWTAPFANFFCNATQKCELSCDLENMEDCDKNRLNGCETNIFTDLDNCGSCGSDCAVEHGTPTCALGDCYRECDTGWENCDTDPTSCETNITTTTNCGDCGIVCTNAHGTTRCSGGICSPTCSAGYENCDSNPNNGCETNINTNINNCGGCGIACSNNHGTPSCASGLCGVASCDAGWRNCNTESVSRDGCETSITTIQNCGDCDITCGVDQDCIGGTCHTSCPSGTADCSIPPDGTCETSITTIQNCGGCGITCTNPHGSTSCVSGACSPSCNPPSLWGICGGSVRLGCLVSLTTDDHCGGCLTSCNTAGGEHCVDCSQSSEGNCASYNGWVCLAEAGFPAPPTINPPP